MECTRCIECGMWCPHVLDDPDIWGVPGILDDPGVWGVLGVLNTPGVPGVLDDTGIWGVPGVLNTPGRWDTTDICIMKALYSMLITAMLNILFLWRLRGHNIHTQQNKCNEKWMVQGKRTCTVFHRHQ